MGGLYSLAALDEAEDILSELDPDEIAEISAIVDPKFVTPYLVGQGFDVERWQVGRILHVWCEECVRL